MQLKQRLLSILLGASLSLPIVSTHAEDFPLDHQPGFQIKSSSGTADIKKPRILIEFIVDNIPNDKASHQFYSELNSSNILYKTQQKVSDFFSKLGVDSNISARRGFVMPPLSSSQNTQGSMNRVISVYYMENDKLKEYYDLDPKRYFIDKERPSWLNEYYSMNIGKFDRNAFSEEGMRKVLDEGLLTKFNKEWYSSLRKEIAGGFAATTTQRVYIYPLHEIFRKAINSDDEEANVLSVIQIHEILHILGERDANGSPSQDIMSPVLYSDSSKNTLRETLKSYLDGQISLSPEKIEGIKRRAGELNTLGSDTYSLKILAK